MSNRTLIEINHDYPPNEAMLEALRRYVRSASREHAEALSVHGVKVLGIRHHSGQFFVENEPEGFPVVVYPPRKARP